MKRIRLLLFLGLALAWLAAAAPALAHANLVRSEPAANSAQQTPPSLVRLWFSEEVEPSFSSVQVLDKTGVQVDKRDARRISDDAKGMQVSLDPLPEGLYTVAWKTTSAVDGHVTSGSFAFTVGAAPLSDSSPREIMSLVDAALAADAPPPLYQVAVRWLNLLLLTLLVGAFIFPLLILFPALYAWQAHQPLVRVYRDYVRGVPFENTLPLDEALRRWLRFVRVVFVLFVAMTLVTPVAQAFTVGAGFDAILRVLTATRFGIVWFFRVLLLVALGLLLYRGRWEWGLACPTRMLLIPAALGILLLVTQSLNSHDAAVSDPLLLPFLTDLVHLFGVVVWVGGLVQLLILLPALIEHEPRFLATLIRVFSFVAFLMVGIVVVSGAYSAVLQVGSLDALFGTLYGTTLFVKFLLILPFLAVGALNLIVMRPAAANSAAARLVPLLTRFDLAIALEVILAAGVLLVVGVMTSSAPAKSAYNPNPTVMVQTRRIDDPAAGAGQSLYVTLGIAPGLVGTNDFDIKVRDGKGRPITNASVVRLLSTMRDMDMRTQETPATNQGEGHYTLRGDTLSMVGNWDIQVLVRRPGVDDVRAGFSLVALGQRVPPPSIDALVLQNTQGLEGLGLTLFALAFGMANILFVKKRAPRRVALGGAIAVALVGAFVVYQSAPTGPATAYVVPSVPPTARLVHSPVAPVPAQLAAGQQIYQQNCASCHGATGKGDGPAASNLSPKPADLTVHAPQHAEGELYWWITNGIPTTAMPAWESRLTDIQRWQVVLFVKTFGAPNAPRAPGAGAATPAVAAPTPAATAPASAAIAPALTFFARPNPDINVTLNVAVPTFTVQVADANNQPIADLARATLEFTLLDENRETVRVNAVRDANGRWTASGDYLSSPGMWRVQFIAQIRGKDTLASWPVYVPSNASRSIERTPAIDPGALALLKKSDARMNQLKTLRARQELNDGANGVVVTDYEYQAPDRLHFTVFGKSRAESIAIGGKQYDLDGGKWTARSRVDPFVFPSFDNAAQVIEAKMGRTENLGGVPTQIVETTVQAASGPVRYAYWIGVEDPVVHQFAMVATAHFMMQFYFDYDAPLQIPAPNAFAPPDRIAPRAGG